MMDISRTMIEHAADEWIIGKNAQRDRQIIKRRLIEGIRYESLAEEFDLSVRHVKNIVYKNQEIIFRHLGI